MSAFGTFTASHEITLTVQECKKLQKKPREIVIYVVIVIVINVGKLSTNIPNFTVILSFAQQV